MPTLNPDHLLEQAVRLVQAPPAGPPRQADVRRAISSAYYALFHAILTAAADEMIGKTKRSTAEYSLVYRSVDHARLRNVCQAMGAVNLPGKIADVAPAGGFGSKFQGIGLAFVELQQRRHDADYDPLLRVKTADALIAVRTARGAIRRLRNTSLARRKRFLTLLLFPPR